MPISAKKSCRFLLSAPRTFVSTDCLSALSIFSISPESAAPSYRRVHVQDREPVLREHRANELHAVVHEGKDQLLTIMNSTASSWSHVSLLRYEDRQPWWQRNRSQELLLELGRSYHILRFIPVGVRYRNWRDFQYFIHIRTCSLSIEASSDMVLLDFCSCVVSKVTSSPAGSSWRCFCFFAILRKNCRSLSAG